MGNACTCNAETEQDHSKDPQRICSGSPPGTLFKVKLFFKQIFLTNGGQAATSGNTDGNIYSEHDAEVGEQDGKEAAQSTPSSGDQNRRDKTPNTTENNLNISCMLDNEITGFSRTASNYVFPDEESPLKSTESNDTNEGFIEISDAETVVCFSGLQDSRSRCKNRSSVTRGSGRSRHAVRSRRSARRKNLRRGKHKFSCKPTNSKGTGNSKDSFQFQDPHEASQHAIEGTSGDFHRKRRLGRCLPQHNTSSSGRMLRTFDSSSQEPLLGTGSSSSAVMSEKSALTPRSYASASTKYTTVFESNLSDDNESCVPRVEPGTEKARVSNFSRFSLHHEMEVLPKSCECRCIQRHEQPCQNECQKLKKHNSLSLVTRCQQSNQCHLLPSHYQNCHSSKHELNSKSIRYDDCHSSQQQLNAHHQSQSYLPSQHQHNSSRFHVHKSTESKFDCSPAHPQNLGSDEQPSCSEQPQPLSFQSWDRISKNFLPGESTPNLQTGPSQVQISSRSTRKRLHDFTPQQCYTLQRKTRDADNKIGHRKDRRTNTHKRLTSPLWEFYGRTDDVQQRQLPNKQHEHKRYFEDSQQQKVAQQFQQEKDFRAEFHELGEQLVEQKEAQQGDVIQKQEGRSQQQLCEQRLHDKRKSSVKTDDARDLQIEQKTFSGEIDNSSKLRRQPFNQILKQERRYLKHDSSIPLREHDERRENDNMFPQGYEINEGVIFQPSLNGTEIQAKSYVGKEAQWSKLHETEETSKTKMSQNKRVCRSLLEKDANFSNSPFGKRHDNEGTHQGIRNHRENHCENGRQNNESLETKENESGAELAFRGRPSVHHRRSKARRKSFRRSAFSRYRKMLQEGPGNTEDCSRSPATGTWRGWMEDGSPPAGGEDAALRMPRGVPGSTPQGGPGRGPREEISLVREAIGALRTNFRSTDPNQHILDTLEQAIGLLVEKKTSGAPPAAAETAAAAGDGDRRNLTGGAGEAQTKVIYFTERTVTPFMSTIGKALGDVRLRDFKQVFDRPGLHRYHFKNYDPEYGMVKEEIVHDDDILPGVEGKIIAWVEEDSE